MTKYRMAALAALFCLVGGGAWAATATGRITYIAADQHHLMLDNSDMYRIGAKVDMSSVGVADRVRIDWDKQGAEDVITSLVKAPLTPGATG